MSRRRKMAVEYVSDIGASAMDLRTYSDAEIADAVNFVGRVNPHLFMWLHSVLGERMTDLAMSAQPGVTRTPDGRRL